MACATLKRSLDWESINQRPTKRRRCNPLGSSTSASPTTVKISEPSQSAFSEAAFPKLTPGMILVHLLIYNYSQYVFSYCLCLFYILMEKNALYS